nr:MAG TPA: hypothetical protein [Caudoviricetes sp.]
MVASTKALILCTNGVVRNERTIGLVLHTS